MFFSLESLTFRGLDDGEEDEMLRGVSFGEFREGEGKMWECGLVHRGWGLGLYISVAQRGCGYEGSDSDGER